MYVLPFGQNGQIFLTMLPFSKPNLKSSLRIGPHPEKIISIIFGSLLGDGYAEKKNGTSICFHMSNKNISYLYWLNKIIYEQGYGKLYKGKINKQIGKKGKIYYSIKSRTYNFTSFNWIHDLFYYKNKKRIPICIQNYLTPLALAIWIMDDGSKYGSGLRISTNNFLLNEIEILKRTIKLNFNIECNIVKQYENQYILTFPAKEMKKLVDIIKPHMCESMNYKLGKYS